jgi:hypothetical protein
VTNREQLLVKVLAVAVPAILIVRFGFLRDSGSVPAVVPAQESASVAVKRLEKLRQVAAAVPGKQETLKQIDAQLALREKGIIATATAAQATAHLFEVSSRIGKAEGIDVRGGELGQVKNFGSDYGEVTAAFSFNCRPEQFVNFMSALSREPELIEPGDIRILTLSPKEKTISVRMSLGGIVPKSLVPEKKGVALF